MKIATRSFLLSSLYCLVAVPAMAQILSIYSDQGIPSGTVVDTWSDGGFGSFNGSSTDGTPPEGTLSFRTSHLFWAGWNVRYTALQNFSAYSGGELRFWANTNNCDIKVEVKQGDGLVKTRFLNLYGCTTNVWKLYKIPLVDFSSTLTFSSISSPFMITANTAATFYVDHVRWTGPTVASPWFNIKLKRRADNVEVSSLTWSNVTLPAGWVAADQYLELSIDPNVTPWGLQIYTDNKAADADPQYTGAGNPVGLVEVEEPARVLPLCWRMVDVTTTTLTIIEAPKPEAPSEHYLYSQELGDGFRCFLWMFDRQTAGFTDGLEYATVWDERGIHFAEGANFGAANPPNHLYIGANFALASSLRTYKTTTLYLEFFTE